MMTKTTFFLNKKTMTLDILASTIAIGYILPILYVVKINSDASASSNAFWIAGIKICFYLLPYHSKLVCRSLLQTQQYSIDYDLAFQAKHINYFKSSCKTNNIKKWTCAPRRLRALSCAFSRQGKTKQASSWADDSLWRSIVYLCRVNKCAVQSSAELGHKKADENGGGWALGRVGD